MRLLPRRVRDALSGATPRVVTGPRVDPRNMIIGGSLLTRSKISVSHERDLVRIDFKGVTISLEYSEAIWLSSVLRGHAKQAKKFNHDTSHWSNFSIATDAEENYKHGR